MLEHLSMVKAANHIGMLVLEDGKAHFLSDTLPGADDARNKVGFKHSWDLCDTDINREVLGCGPYTEIPVTPELRALNQSIEIWCILAENGKDSSWKRDTFTMYHHGCPLCSHVISTEGMITPDICESRCPMYGRWGASRCENVGSIYRAWKENPDASSRKVEAQGIVDMMVELREEMLNKILSEKLKEEKKVASIILNTLKKRVVEEVVQKAVRFELKSEGGEIVLHAVDEDGFHLPNGNILVITNSGTIERCYGVSEDIGLQLNEGNQVVVQ